MSFSHLGLKRGYEFLRDRSAPEVTNLLDDGIGDPGVPPDHSRIEEAERNAEIPPSSFEDLFGSAYRMVNAYPLVPHWVPQGVCDFLDVAAAFVDQHEI
jgi:hypothetical protein